MGIWSITASKYQNLLTAIIWLYSLIKNVTNFLYLVLYLARKVTCYFQLFSLVLVSVLKDWFIKIRTRTVVKSLELAIMCSRKANQRTMLLRLLIWPNYFYQCCYYKIWVCSRVPKVPNFLTISGQYTKLPTPKLTKVYPIQGWAIPAKVHIFWEGIHIRYTLENSTLWDRKRVLFRPQAYLLGVS